jgi:hypothetical protein
METKTFGALKILVKNDENKTMISFVGRSDDRNPAKFLNPFFDELVNELDGELDVEFRELEFMNSSTVPPLLHFIKNLDKKGIQSCFYYSKDSRWQTASFKALKTISEALKSIRIEAK